MSIERGEAARECDALQQQLAESRAALAEYGRHKHDCRVVGALPSSLCTCGFSDVLAASSPTEESL